ncbi:MAG: SnoaL-like domain-containing protein [Bacteroidota bacterium]
MSYLEKSQALQAMIGQGQSLEALEQFYHEDVVVIDGGSEPRNGKEAQKQAILGWMGMVKEVHGGGVNSITADESNGITMVESWIETTFQDGSRVKMEEVAVQKWDGDKIIHERFYHNMPSG